MSCVAEAKATITANQTMRSSEACGSVTAMPHRPAMISSCASSSQLRRCPSQRVISGSRRRSTSGAQIHFTP